MVYQVPSVPVGHAAAVGTVGTKGCWVPLVPIDRFMDIYLDLYYFGAEVPSVPSVG